MIAKHKAIELLEKQITTGNQILEGQQKRTSNWQLDTHAILERIFGRDTRQTQYFEAIRWGPSILISGHDNSGAYDSAYKGALRKAIALLESAIVEIRTFWDSEQPGVHTDPFLRIERICERFHIIVRKLRERYNNRPTLDVTDEYDVQDLIHALLLVDFEDVRKEEYAPSCAGASSRIDFLLKRERIVLETKRSRKGLTAKVVGEELIIDSRRYKEHPDCKSLVCFVYDPEGFIANPRGIENDLSISDGNLPVKVFIRP